MHLEHCVNWLSSCGDNIPNTTNLKEERLILAYNFHILLAFCTWVEPHGDGRSGGGGCSAHGRWKGEREEG